MAPRTGISPEWEPRLLVVDDDLISRLAIAELLRSLGFVVDVASGGPEALTLNQGWPYVAIFMDCEMPGVDGYTAARTLRRRGAAGSGPLVIAVTSHPRSVSMASGMDHHLTKPLRVDVLRTECRRLDLLGPESQSTDSARPLCIDTPLLDPQMFAPSVVSDRDPKARATASFLKAATLRLPELWRATNAGDAQAIETVALAVGRHAGLVGAARAGAVCDRLREAAAGSTDTGSVERQLRAVLRDTAGAVTDYVDAFVRVDESGIAIPDSVLGAADVRDVAPARESAPVALADDDPTASITKRRGPRVGAARAPAGQDGAPARRSALNWTSVERLHHDLDATGILSELVELFGSETPQRLRELRGAVDAGDAQTVTRHAHQLKGGCRTLAAEYAAELCNELEVAAGDGSLEGAEALVSRIDEALQAAHASLRREFPPPEVPRPALK